MDQNSTINKQQRPGFLQSEKDHWAHFYSSDDELLPSLTEYVKTGLKVGETCIVIATLGTLISLNKNLRGSRIDLAKAIEDHSYITYDAEQMLAKIMVNEMPDRAMFEQAMGGIIALAAGRNAPIRIFGEMAGVLLKRGNLQAVARLEEYCNDLMREHAFSLYCGYPESGFSKKLYHQKLLKDVCGCHNLTTRDGFYRV